MLIFGMSTPMQYKLDMSFRNGTSVCATPIFSKSNPMQYKLDVPFRGGTSFCARLDPAAFPGDKGTQPQAAG